MSKNKIITAFIIQNAVILFISIVWLNFRTNINLLFDYTKLNIYFVILYGLIGGLVLSIISIIIFLSSESIRQNVIEIDKLFLSKLNIKELIYISIVAGICEEIFFRGILVNEIGVLISSFIFALLHVPNIKFWFYGAWAFLAGLYLGNIYVLTQNLLVPIIIHIVNNILAVLIWSKLKYKFVS